MRLYQHAIVIDMQIRANLVDIRHRNTFAACVTIEGGVISRVEAIGGGAVDRALPYALPGFVDAHVHIESSMLVPSEFARIAVRHGTVATVSDPHEIANVMGVEGVDFMIRDGLRVPLKFFFGAPSCVPATTFESAGAEINASQVDDLLQRDDIHYLAEMMNYPGVLAQDDQVMRKLASAKRLGKPIDGHAPGLIGEDADRYAEAGIMTDHECTSFEEAKYKLSRGMKILIREGSAARNFEFLYPLIDLFPDSVMFCSDDKHPDELAVSHINALVARAIAKGCDRYNVLRAACLNPVDHYRLDVGTLREGEPADLILVEDLERGKIDRTFIDGQLVATGGMPQWERLPTSTLNYFECSEKSPDDFRLPRTAGPTRAIEAIDGSLLTRSVTVHPDSDADCCLLAVVNRYRDAPVARCFVRGFGIKDGAIASSVAHDSHNILAVGQNEQQLCRAVNLVIQNRGGIVAVFEQEQLVLPLPIAGIMSDLDGDAVAQRYQEIDRFAKQRLKTTLAAPFMTLSFMALLVIPSLKLSDHGLFDAEKFELIDPPE